MSGICSLTFSDWISDMDYPQCGIEKGKIAWLSDQAVGDDEYVIGRPHATLVFDIFGHAIETGLRLHYMCAPDEIMCETETCGESEFPPTLQMRVQSVEGAIDPCWEALPAQNPHILTFNCGFRAYQYINPPCGAVAFAFTLAFEPISDPPCTAALGAMRMGIFAGGLFGVVAVWQQVFDFVDFDHRSLLRLYDTDKTSCFEPIPGLPSPFSRMVFSLECDDQP